MWPYPLVPFRITMLEFHFYNRGVAMVFAPQVSPPRTPLTSRSRSPTDHLAGKLLIRPRKVSAQILLALSLRGPGASFCILNRFATCPGGASKRCWRGTTRRLPPSRPSCVLRSTRRRTLRKSRRAAGRPSGAAS